jgi:hypothetical protein
MQKLNDNNTYNISKNVILYHGTTNIKTFDPFNIKLGNLKLILFSSKKKFAVDHIMNYGLILNNKKCYVHKFKVKYDIPNICIISKEANELTEKNIEQNYCNPHSKINGIGYFNSSDEEYEYIELALSNPLEYLEYI